MKILYSIRSKLVITYLVCLIIPVFIFLWLMLCINIKWLEEGINSNFMQVFDSVNQIYENKIDRFVKNNTSSLVNNESIYKYLNSNSRDKEFYKISVEDEFIRLINLSIGEINSISLISLNGGELVSVYQNIRKRTDFRALHSDKNKHISSLFLRVKNNFYDLNSTFDIKTNKLYVMSPILSKNYHVHIGYILLEIKMKDFIDAIKDIRLDNDAVIWLFTNDRQIIYKPNNTRGVLSPFNGVEPKKIDVNNIVYNDQGYFMLSGLSLNKTDSINFYFGVGLSKEFFVSKSRALFFNGAYVALFLCILFVISLIFLDKVIVKPLLQIKNRVKNNADINTHSKIDIPCNNELGEIAAVINETISNTLLLQENLEEEIAKRTHILQSSNNALTFSINSLDKSNLEKDKFLACIAHELRTPLTSIIGLSEISLLHTLEPEISRNFININDSANSLLSIVNGILDYSKIQSKKIKIEYNIFDLYDLLQEVVLMMEPKASDKKIELLINYELNDRCFSSDEKRIKQVLVNLVGNAIKFTSRGSVNINVSSSESLNEMVNINFEVLDTGVGIAQDDLGRVFMSFSQAANSEKKMIGTGLGLAISKSIVEMLGGDIGVTSKIGSGSRFWFTVPARPLKSCAVAENNPIKFDPLNKRILIVDDTELNLEICKTMLMDLGCEVVTVTNALDAIEVTYNTKFDLIFMDCFIPEVDGFKIAKEIRHNAENMNIETPIIAFTASTEIGIREKCIQSGMNSVLEKPFKQKDIYNVVERWAN